MKQFCVLFFLTLFSYLPLFAQFPSIAITYPETACLGAVQKIQVHISGSYNPDNRFAVQIRKAENQPVISEIPAQLVDGKIEVLHSDSSLSIPLYVQLRIVTTSPKTESNWYNNTINTKGIVSLALAASDTINAGEDLLLKFTTFSSSTANITLNDSSTFSPSSWESGYFNTYHRKGVSVVTPFYIAHAENSCGAMKVSGQVKATINTTSIRTLSVSPDASCEGSEIKVSFATSGTALHANTKYKLRIAIFQEDRINAKTVEVPAELKDNLLVARFPKAFNVTGRSKYKLRIVTENPALLGTDTDFDFTVYPNPSAIFSTPSKTIEMGEKLTIGLSFSGIAPYSATLQDGTVISSSQDIGTVDVRPDKTTPYSVTSISTGCGAETISSSPTMVVTVKQGIAMDPTVGQKVFCVGEMSKVRMLSNVTFNAGTTFFVNAVINNQTAYSFPAQKLGDYLEFQIPPLPKGTDYAMSYDKVTAFFISSNNPAYKSPLQLYDYKIRSMPEMILLPHFIFNYNKPSESSFGYELRGNGPYKIEDSEGKIYDIDGYSVWYPRFYVNKSLDFKLKLISNSCFKNETIPSARLTFDTTGAPPGIYIQPANKLICRRDSIEITFVKTGKFNSGNVFNIEGYIDCCTFQKLASVNKDGTYKVKIPVSPFPLANVNFRISSTNPVIISEEFRIEMQNPPTGFSINPSGTSQSPAEFMVGDEVRLWPGTREGGISSFVYSDGATEQTSPVFEAFVKPPSGTVTAYTIKSARNECGNFPVNLTTYVRVIPYRIMISRGEEGKSLSACQNGDLTVPFVILNGDASQAEFTLQIARENTSEFVDLAKTQTLRTFNLTIPASTATGRYKMRVISSEGSISGSVDLIIGAAPSAILSTTETQPIVLNPGQGVYANIQFTGTSPWTMIYENSQKETTDNNPYRRSISATEQKDFSLISVYNRCGYGEVSGKISVKINPTFGAWADVQDICAGSNISVRYLLQGDATLTNDYIIFQLVDRQSKKAIGLDSTRAKGGNILLRIPASLSGNIYELRCIVKSYNLSTTLPVNIKSKVDVSLWGNTTINPGESTQLQILSNKPVNEPIKYTLSDGQTGTFYGGNGNSESFIKVNPGTTTTYTILYADNGCGDGKKSGSATVEVNPVSQRTVSVTKWEAFENSAFCLGDAILVYYSQTGSFSPGNVMTVQISDTTGRNFKSVATTGNTSPLKASVPNDLFAGAKYRIRVMASDAGTGSSAYEYPLSPGTKATARFASESVIQDWSGTSKLVVSLKGTGPWQYDLGSSLSTKKIYASSAIDTVYLFEKPLAKYYKILGVSNRCGAGSVEKPDQVTVELITGEPAHLVPEVIAAPNPVENELIVRFPDPSEKNIRLLSASGIPVFEKSSSQKEELLKIGQLSPGIYILSIEGKHHKSVHKIIKR